MKRFFILVFALFQIQLEAQVVSKDGKVEYSKVFEETDDFGSDYLEKIEQSLPPVKETELRLQMLWDLGYYYHTRNLRKSLSVINQGLEEARMAESELWEGRMQVAQGAIMLRMEQLDQAEEVLQSALEKLPESETWLLLTNL
ncbi:MAG: signal transduction histidine kinase, partial [Algoriphagus marincola HL-49]